MSKIKLTRKLCFAIGEDAGNRSMRRAGRKTWNREDYDKACEITNKLLNKMK